jgi:hypothetical protein
MCGSLQQGVCCKQLRVYQDRLCWLRTVLAGGEVVAGLQWRLELRTMLSSYSGHSNHAGVVQQPIAAVDTRYLASQLKGTWGVNCHPSHGMLSHRASLLPVLRLHVFH